MQPRSKNLTALLLALLLLALAFPAAPAPPPEDYAPGILHDLTGVEEFRALFNREQGRPRVVLLLSPT